MSLHFRDSWLEILIVAADPERLRLSRDALRAERGRVHVARDGAEARALLNGPGELDERVRPNVVVLDLSLPGSEWPVIARAIVAARLAGPVIAIEWMEGEVRAAASGESPERDGKPAGDLSRLIRRAILQKRTEDERAARLELERQTGSPGSEAGGARALGSGGVDGPGSHAGIGQSWLHLVLRERTEAGILEGLAALRSLADRLRAGSAGNRRVGSPVTTDIWPNELIGRVAERYRPVAAARGLRLLEIEDEYAPRISADEAGLLTALGILTSYVLHFGRPDQEVRISTGVGANEAVDFGVSLHGAGIAEDHLPVLADAFDAASPIVEAHGATLAFGSSWGKSCGFGFVLPASMSDPGAFYEYDDSA